MLRRISGVRNNATAVKSLELWSQSVKVIFPSFCWGGVFLQNDLPTLSIWVCKHVRSRLQFGALKVCSRNQAENRVRVSTSAVFVCDPRMMHLAQLKGTASAIGMTAMDMRPLTILQCWLKDNKIERYGMFAGFEILLELGLISNATGTLVSFYRLRTAVDRFLNRQVDKPYVVERTYMFMYENLRLLRLLKSSPVVCCSVM